VSGLLLSIALVRRFGLSAAGDYALAAVAIATLAIACSVGLPYSLARAAEPVAEKNAIGMLASLLIMPVSFPLIGLYGYLAGQDLEEAIVISLLACGGWFFAQTNIFYALFVLQDRVRLAIIPPIVNIVGIAVAAAFANSLLVFAATLVVARLVGIFGICLRLPYRAVSPRRLWRHLYPSLGILSADLVNYGSDQLLVLAMSYLVNRQELGILGLSRQIVSIADIPGGSLLQTAYPAMVQDPQAELTMTRKRMLTLAGLTMVGCAGLALPLGIWVYRVPLLPAYAALLLTSLPARYILSLCETYLKAIHQLRTLNWLAVLRGVAWAATAPLCIFGLYAAFIGFVVHACLSACAAMFLVKLRARTNAD
jgi:O-antigen/teichoic acid export membrane protein